MICCIVASCAHPSIRPVSFGAGETGRASWYGPEFHGRRTSSGEIYDMYQLTAAHRELPLGTWVMVTNLNNGRSVEVRVNDRGPFVQDRILDVSYAAARLLGMIGSGVVPVRVVVTHVPAGDGTELIGLRGRYTIQVGSFVSEENAKSLERDLVGSFPNVEVVRRTIGGDTFFRVRVGDFAGPSEAVVVAERLAARGLNVLILERN
jgi:rare lipoprotein A